MLTWNGIPVYPKGLATWSNDIAAAHTVHAGSDILVTLFDAWPLVPEQLQQHGVRWIPWYPVDMDPIPPAVARNVGKAYDRIVFSKFGQRMTEQAGMSCHYVPHGVDTKTFRPLDQADARKSIGWPNDKFIIGMVAANKGNPSRKALAEHLMAFKKLHDKHDDTLLYLHTSSGANGEYGGINLPQLALELGLERAVFYADQYKRYATYVRSYGSNRVFKIACGPRGTNPFDLRRDWTLDFFREYAKVQHPSQRPVDGFALHFYTRNPEAGGDLGL